MLHVSKTESYFTKLARAQNEGTLQISRAVGLDRAAQQHTVNACCEKLQPCITHQERLSDDIFDYFQIVLHGLVLGVGSLHLFIGEEAEQKGLVLELALLQHFERSEN